jgi:hypothetical protein
MVNKLPIKQEKSPKSIADSFENMLISWQKEKKSGKLIIEIHFNQGGIAGCDQKTESKFC